MTTSKRIIEQLITKFFYRNNQLFFQILLNCDNNFTVTYGEYTDYTTYKQDYNQLLGLKTAGKPVSLSENRVKTTHSIFS